MDEQPQLHDLTKLLLKRFEAHPDEFTLDLRWDDCGAITWLHSHRWQSAIGTIRSNGTEADTQAIRRMAMDIGLRKALEKLLEPEEPVTLGAGGGTPVGVPNNWGNNSFSSVFQTAAAQQAAPLSLTQAQVFMQAQQAQQVHQPSSVTVPRRVAEAMGLKTPTVKETLVETYEQLKKKVGL